MSMDSWSTLEKLQSCCEGLSGEASRLSALGLMVGFLFSEMRSMGERGEL